MLSEGRSSVSATLPLISRRSDLRFYPPAESLQVTAVQVLRMTDRIPETHKHLVHVD